MKIHKSSLIISVVFSVIIFFSGCFQRDFEENLFADNTVGLVSSLSNVYNHYYIDSVFSNNNTPYKFKSDIFVYVTVSADDKTGNLYKSVYAQDSEYGINLRIICPSGNSTGLYVGDSIRINLKNTILSDYHGIKQIDSIDVDKNILKIANKCNVTPISVEGTNVNDELVCRLVKLENVEFVADEVGKIYAEENSSGTDRLLEACGVSGTLIVRTSGYANFASNLIPEGKGYIIGILSKYNNNFQLILRNDNEVVLNKLRCGETLDLFTENFDSQTVGSEFSLDGWINISNSSANKWTIAAINGGNPAAKIKNESPIDTTWLVLPEMSIPNKARFSFETFAMNASTCKMEVLYSTSSITSGIPKNATWSNPLATINVNGTTDVSIPEGNYSVAIRFIGSASANSSATFYVDNIKIYEEED